MITVTLMGVLAPPGPPGGPGLEYMIVSSPNVKSAMTLPFDMTIYRPWARKTMHCPAGIWTISLSGSKTSIGPLELLQTLAIYRNVGTMMVTWVTGTRYHGAPTFKFRD